MAHAKTCEVCFHSPCQCDDLEDWLYKDTPAEMSAAEFLAWHREQGYGEGFGVEKPIDIPWKELVNLVGIILMILGKGSLAAEDVARQVLPLIRPATSASAREGG